MIIFKDDHAEPHVEAMAYLHQTTGHVLGLPKDSVANVSQIITIDRDHLVELAGRAPGPVLAQIYRGLRTVLDL